MLNSYRFVGFTSIGSLHIHHRLGPSESASRLAHPPPGPHYVGEVQGSAPSARALEAALRCVGSKGQRASACEEPGCTLRHGPKFDGHHLKRKPLPLFESAIPPGGQFSVTSRSPLTQGSHHCSAAANQWTLVAGGHFYLLFWRDATKTRVSRCSQSRLDTSLNCDSAV